MKKLILLILLMASVSFAQGIKEPTHIKELRHGVRVEGCVAGLMYYTRDNYIPKAMRIFCEAVIKDASFLYDFKDRDKINPMKNNFIRKDIKI